MRHLAICVPYPKDQPAFIPQLATNLNGVAVVAVGERRSALRVGSRSYAGSAQHGRRDDKDPEQDRT
jgi:hypothetical protein